ncbi:DUF4214 domain-containing protein (plasmid) [Azospirillum sp. HJ39]|uniref:DUF4214 domain-containing protein n=1 Tax=Azospirillum sp. HJ39 TaxID=3159496 RepID=UPI00355746B5
MSHLPKTLCLGCHDPISRCEAERLASLSTRVHVDTQRSPAGMTSTASVPPAAVLGGYDAVIVWNDLSLFAELIRAFPGFIVFRSHGDRTRVAAALWQCFVRTIVESRNNIRVLFSQPEDIGREEPWIARLSRWTQQTAADVTDNAVGTWSRSPHSGRPVGMLVPKDAGSLHRPYLQRTTRFILDNFASDGFQPIDDPAGSHDGAEPSVIDVLQGVCGLFHPYVGEGKLPHATIAMLLLGGPVVYFERSMLSRRIPPGSPGEVRTIEDARALCRRLREGDQALANAMIHAQGPVQGHYRQSNVWPNFDRNMREFIAEAVLVMGKPGSRPVFVDHGDWGARELASRIVDGIKAPIQEEPALRRRFIETMYNVLLERDPDPSGRAHHERELQEHGRGDITLNAFMNSQEMRLRWPVNRTIRWLASSS